MTKSPDNLFVVFGGLVLCTWLLDFGSGISSAITVFATIFTMLVAVNAISAGEAKSRKKR